MTSVVCLYLLAPAILVFVVPLPWNIVLGLGVLVALVDGTRRAFRIALVIGPEEVTVANFGRVEKIPWAEISSVSLRWAVEGSAWSPCVLLELRGAKRSVLARATYPKRDRRKALHALEPLAKRWAVQFNVPAEELLSARA